MEFQLESPNIGCSREFSQTALESSFTKGDAARRLFFRNLNERFDFPPLLPFLPPFMQ